jgi:hypothetical protein
MNMDIIISKKLREKYRKEFEHTVGKDYLIMEREAMKKLRKNISELYGKFLEEEFGKWVQVYMD